MKKKMSREEQLRKERAIKFAASLGINLTVSDKPSDKIYFPEKVEEANKVIANMRWTHINK